MEAFAKRPDDPSTAGAGFMVVLDMVAISDSLSTIKLAEDTCMGKRGFASDTALKPLTTKLSKEPVLGNFMVLVAAAMKQLQYNASGVRIAELLEEQLQTQVSNAQVYVALKRMQDAKLIEFVGEASSKNGPPLRTYKLSEVGEAELILKAEHSRQLAGFLEDVLGKEVGANPEGDGTVKRRRQPHGTGVSHHVGRKKTPQASGHSGRTRT